MIKLIASEQILEKAYQWLVKQRSHYHFNADIWQLRRNWASHKLIIQRQLIAGKYRFRELRSIVKDGEHILWWHSTDALVLKAISLVLTDHLSPYLSERCFHLSGGTKAAVREVAEHLPQHRYVFRTDVKSYYASIDHHILMKILGLYVKDDLVLELVWGYLRCYISDGGKFISITKGISLGCPLSPLIGALFLKPLDDRMAKLGCFYTRFMDDWVILTPSRWKLRKAIKAVNEVMFDLQISQHPDKTFIGAIERGFDFLGYYFSNNGLSIATKTIERMRTKVSRLYEQGATQNCIETYLKRWWIWAKAGVTVYLSRFLDYLQSPTPLVGSGILGEVYWLIYFLKWAKI